MQPAALEVFFWLNVEGAALKFARPRFVSSPGLCVLPRLHRFGGNFEGLENPQAACFISFCQPLFYRGPKV